MKKLINICDRCNKEIKQQGLRVENLNIFLLHNPILHHQINETENDLLPTIIYEKRKLLTGNYIFCSQRCFMKFFKKRLRESILTRR